MPLERVPRLLRDKVLACEPLRMQTPGAEPDERSVFCFKRMTACFALVAPLVCAGCSKTRLKDPALKLKRCSACQLAWYCGKECQKRDWKAHRKEQCGARNGWICIKSGDAELQNAICAPFFR